MNCRPGDLAVVTGPRLVTPGLRDRLVIVERAVLDGEIFDSTAGPYKFIGDVPCWVCSSAVTGATLPTLTSKALGESTKRPIIDSVLRPIRPNEGEDESLSWAKPQIKEQA